MTRRTVSVRSLLIAVGLLVLAAIIAVQIGLARAIFYEMYAFVKGDEIVADSVLRISPQNSPYQQWLEQSSSQVPIFEGWAIDDIATIDLRAWSQQGEGVRGLYLHFAGYQMTDGRLIEIPPGGKTDSQRKLYEKAIYFVSGEGYTVLQQEGQPLQRVAWKAGDLFSVPLNVLHQHFNSGGEPARLLTITTFPLVLNVFDSERFIDKSTHAFTERYDFEPEFLSSVKEASDYELETNFVEDIGTVGTRRHDFRGEGNSTIRWLMAGNSMLDLHISEMPPRMYKKAHRHSSDAFILLLSGEGFSVTWREGAYDERKRVDWKAGTLFVPPMFWYHQHLNSGSTPARYLAINVPRVVKNLGMRFEDQIEVDLEEVQDEWERELRKVATEP